MNSNIQDSKQSQELTASLLKQRFPESSQPTLPSFGFGKPSPLHHKSLHKGRQQTQLKQQSSSHSIEKVVGGCTKEVDQNSISTTSLTLIDAGKKWNSSSKTSFNLSDEGRGNQNKDKKVFKIRDEDHRLLNQKDSGRIINQIKERSKDSKKPSLGVMERYGIK